MDSVLILHVYVQDETLSTLYNDRKSNHSTDSGIDLYCPEEIVVKARQQAKINFEIKARLDECTLNGNTQRGYFLFPRSSIVKTPLRMSNSIGLIDADYKGNICAFVDNISEQDYTISRHQRLFQLVGPSLRPMSLSVHIGEDSLARDPDNSRKEGGFGSTGI